MLPHYPASSEWATVGGYVAARGSGVLSTRYGKIEDLVLSLRVALAGGELIDTVSVPRHAVGPELTQLFVGCEGTLGIITRATLEIVPLPPERRFFTLQFPNVAAGIEAFRSTLAAGYRPSVIRMYDEEATARTFAPVVGESLRASAPSCAARARRPPFPWRGPAPSSSHAGSARASSTRRSPSAGGTAATSSTSRRITRSCRRSGARSTSSRTYTNIIGVHEALKTAVRDRYADRGLQLRMHFSHWYRWGTMIYARFLIPDGGEDALTLHDQIWEDGITAVLAAGGVMNDHHGVGLKLAPFMAAQHGPALDALRRIKTALDPTGIMNPGKLGL